MHTTVRGGKSTHRWAFDQGGGGYQGMEVNADPQLTNGAGGGGQGSPGASGGGGWEDEFRELCQLIQTAMSPEDATQAEGLLHRLLLSGENANAMGGEAMPVGRPTPVTQAADGRPRGSGPGGQVMACDSEAIEDVLRRGRARQAQRSAASIEKRFPGALSRLRRAF
jgi:hypothetical protein